LSPPREWDAYIWGKASKGSFSLDKAQTFSEAGHNKPLPKTRFKKTAQPPHKKGLAKPPKEVKPVRCLRFDLKALDALFNEDTPAEVLLRAARVS
jgi:hypothetical protein